MSKPYKIIIMFLFLPLFLVKSLEANFIITSRAVSKMKGGTITKALSFLFYYLGGLPFCMIEFFKQALQEPEELEAKKRDEIEGKHGQEHKPCKHEERL